MAGTLYYPKKLVGKDFNKFSRALVDGYAFDEYADVVFNFRATASALD